MNSVRSLRDSAGKVKADHVDFKTRFDRLEQKLVCLKAANNVGVRHAEIEVTQCLWQAY